MNLKKAKSLRRAVKAVNKHPRHVALIEQQEQFIPAPPFALAGGRLRPSGPGCTFLGRRYLQPTCGRGAYQELKKAVLRGQVA